MTGDNLGSAAAAKTQTHQDPSQEAIYKLWDELSDYPASRTNDAIQYFLTRMCQWLKAENAFWIGAMRVQRGAKARSDPMSGWRAGAIYMLRPALIEQSRQKTGLRAINRDDAGETSRALAAQSGHFRLVTLQSGELVDPTAFRKTAHYDHNYRTLGVCDRLWAVFPVNADTEAYYCFDKLGKGRQFTQRDKDLAAHVIRGMKWFHRRVLLSHGLGVSSSALTPTERRTLQSLLAGATEKQIAEQLGLTPGSVHQYATAIYRKFGVHGRTRLMALWLSGTFQSPSEQ